MWHFHRAVRGDLLVGVRLGAFARPAWSSAAGQRDAGGKRNILSPRCLEEIGNIFCGFRFTGQQVQSGRMAAIPDVPSLSSPQRRPKRLALALVGIRGFFTTASSQPFLFVQSVGNAFGDASQGGSFPLRYCVPEVLQALKLLLVFAVLTRPSSACECGIFTFDLFGDLVCPHLRCLPWL